MRIGLYIASNKKEILDVLISIINNFIENDIEFVAFKDEGKFAEKFEESKFFKGYYYDSASFIDYKPDFLISIGGDGTLLNTILFLKNSQIPVLGLNLGRLGFLSNNPINKIQEIVSKLINKQYQLEERSIIELVTDNNAFRDENIALNDFTIHKRDNSSLTTISTFLDGELLNTYWGDGIIVSTPTGSTAYSLSCGGPIVFPESNNFIITAVAPHNLNVRPVVVPDNLKISFKIRGKEKKYLVSLDSRYEIVGDDVNITIKKAGFYLKTIRFNDQNFSSILREKLMWGRDKRNI